MPLLCVDRALDSLRVDRSNPVCVSAPEGRAAPVGFRPLPHPKFDVVSLGMRESVGGSWICACECVSVIPGVFCACVRMGVLSILLCACECVCAIPAHLLPCACGCVVVIPAHPCACVFMGVWCLCRETG